MSTRRSRTRLAGLFTAFALFTGASAAGAQTSLGFGPTLSGWSVVGDAGVPLPSAPVVPAWAQFPALYPDGALLATTASFAFGDDSPFAAGAVNLTGAEPLPAGLALEAAFGVAPGALDPDPLLANATEGSGVARTLSVNAGDRLRFDWQFLTLDTAGQDYSFAVIDGTVIRLGGAEIGVPLAPLVPVGGGASQMALAWNPAGWRSAEVVFTRTGTVTVGFGVVDVGDFSVSSAIAVDNVVLTPVPEPGELAMMVAGLCAVAAAGRRRERRAADRRGRGA